MRLPRSLLALTPGELRGQMEFAGLLRSIELALEAGLPALLLREPQLCGRDLQRLAREVVDLCDGFENRWCGVHDSIHVALDAGAQGVHLGFRSMTPAVARTVVGENMAIGFSAHATEPAAAWHGANYLSFGPVYATPSKEGWLESVGPEALDAFAHSVDLPVFGLGGMTPERVAEGGGSKAGVAVLSGILRHSDPAGATERFLQAIGDRP